VSHSAAPPSATPGKHPVKIVADEPGAPPINQVGDE